MVVGMRGCGGSSAMYLIEAGRSMQSYLGEVWTTVSRAVDLAEEKGESEISVWRQRIESPTLQRGLG
jgi:hypothetical protein